MTPLCERQTLVKLVQEACESGCRLISACDAIGISLRTWRRWLQQGTVVDDQRPHAKRPPPVNKLSDAERAQVLEVCNQPEYAGLPPSQIVPALLDQKIYIASESTFYRILKESDQLHHRGKSKAPERHTAPQTYTATGPNQVYTWDITYLPSAIKGIFYYLYMIIDIYSRKIVGYEVYDRECGELASDLLQRTLVKEKQTHSGIVLHSDNGSPMKSMTFQAKMEALGIIKSYSRPRVSNDNPYSESLFRTLKYCPKYPKRGFDSLEECRKWTQNFTRWYNYEHKHSRIKFVTPEQRHTGQDKAILAERAKVLMEAKKRHPERWKGDIRDCQPVGHVTLNPDKEAGQNAPLKQAA